MRKTTEKLSVKPATDSSTVNLTCLLLLQSDGLDVAPGWGDCSCAVCQRHLAKQLSVVGTTEATGHLDT